MPAAPEIEVEAMVLNRDIGFVTEGQAAEVKLEAFPFTRYGVVPGVVSHVSRDAVADDKAGLTYPTRIRLLADAIAVDGRRVRLGPGMAATAEIRTGTRRVIEYVLSPLLRYRDESLRER